MTVPEAIAGAEAHALPKCTSSHVVVIKSLQGPSDDGDCLLIGIRSLPDDMQVLTIKRVLACPFVALQAVVWS